MLQRAAIDAGDLPAVEFQKLSGIAKIEADRKILGLDQKKICEAAGIATNSYWRYLTGRLVPKPGVLARLERALVHLSAAPRLSAIEADLIASAYRSAVALLVPVLGGGAISVADVHASDPRRGATADPHWRTCRRIVQAALYLINISFDIPQRRLAELAGLTPAAVCLALREIEDLRDDPDFERALLSVQETIAGHADA